MRFYATRVLIVLLATITAFSIGIGVEIVSLRFFATYQDPKLSYASPRCESDT